MSTRPGGLGWAGSATRRRRWLVVLGLAAFAGLLALATWIVRPMFELLSSGPVASSRNPDAFAPTSAAPPPEVGTVPAATEPENAPAGSTWCAGTDRTPQSESEEIDEAAC